MKKFSVIIFSILCMLSQYTYSQEKYYLTDIRMDSITLGNIPANYLIHFSNCVITEEKTYWDDEIEQNVRKFTVNCDSILMQNEEYSSTGNIYTNVIEILASKHSLFYEDEIFFVGMTIDEVGRIFPSIQNDYKKYLKKHKDNYDKVIRLGKQLYANVNGISEDVLVQGIKFNILRGTIISIAVDFRTDGDF